MRGWTLNFNQMIVVLLEVGKQDLRDIKTGHGEDIGDVSLYS
jgi:hypothetical protein